MTSDNPLKAEVERLVEERLAAGLSLDEEDIVNAILAKHGHPPPSDFDEAMSRLRQEIDEIIDDIIELGEVPTREDVVAVITARHGSGEDEFTAECIQFSVGRLADEALNRRAQPGADT